MPRAEAFQPQHDLRQTINSRWTPEDRSSVCSMSRMATPCTAKGNRILDSAPSLGGACLVVDKWAKSARLQTR
ncbi:hypothetical protein cyc_03724 [Cyclospora cayetanensis]|uniref:Uncharacterized protein n=1 Tax=Cyclospora cayetanensis TaxID=88456 RepID=A0A1D3D9S6_9EIME|nr:hypothetical protein cyc_03724 [Cyclospora cayetanensis]